MKKERISETSNQILIKIASGVNYASDLAKNMGKSIPVMFRQLDELLGKGILTKKRSGKKVEYEMNWKNLSKNFAEFVEKEFEASKKILPNMKPPFPNKRDLQDTFESVFLTDYLQGVLKEMYQDIESAGKISYDYAKMKFNDSINLLMEIFGTTNKEEEILKKIPENKKKDFKKFIKTSKDYVKIKKEIDPRNKIKEKL